MHLLLTGAIIIVIALLIAMLIRRIFPEYGDIGAIVILILALIAIARVAGVF